MTTPPTPGINNEAKILRTIMPFKSVDEYGEQGVDKLPDFIVGHVL